MGISPEELVARVQVNVPFAFLVKGYLEKFLAGNLNPEIGLDAFSLENFGPEVFRRIAHRFLEAGRRITLHAPFQDLLPGALDGEIRGASRRRLRQAFEFLAIFRPAAIICHLGYDEKLYRWDREAWLSHSADTWRELAALAEAQGVGLRLENVYEPDPTLFLDLLARLKAPNVQLCFDVGHLAAFGGGDFDGWLGTLWPYIGHLHLHDNHGGEDEHLALGTGDIPVGQVLQFLAARGRRPLITLEPHQEGSLAPSLAYLAPIWPWD